MKHIFKYLLAALLINAHLLSFSQAPAKFNYQAVIRDASGNGVVNQNVDIRFQIYDNPSIGNVVFQQDFAGTNTGNFGVVNLQVGDATLSELHWGGQSYYANIQMKQSGGSYVDISSTRTQLVSVPYALFAHKSDTAGYAVSAPQTSYSAGTGINITGGQIVNTAPNQNQTISISANKDSISISNGNSVALFNPWNDYAIYDFIVTTALSANGWGIIPLNSTQSSNGNAISRSGTNVTLIPGTYYIVGTSFIDESGDAELGLNDGTNFVIYGSHGVASGVGSAYHGYANLSLTGVLNVITQTTYTLQVYAGSGGNINPSSIPGNKASTLFIQKIK